jgi:hypothetical protein
MVAGRPIEYDLEEMAKELIEWSKEATSLNLIGFSSPRGFSVTRLPDYARTNPKFSEALQLAKENISQNRFDAACAEVMPEKFYSRCEGMYDPLYHRHERREKKFDSQLRAKEEGKNKYQPVTVKVSHGLGSGVKVSTKRLPNTDNNSSE